jgi:hypothetical protein
MSEKEIKPLSCLMYNGILYTPPISTTFNRNMNYDKEWYIMKKSKVYDDKEIKKMNIESNFWVCKKYYNVEY